VAHVAVAPAPELQAPQQAVAAEDVAAVKIADPAIISAVEEEVEEPLPLHSESKAAATDAEEKQEGKVEEGEVQPPKEAAAIIDSELPSTDVAMKPAAPDCTTEATEAKEDKGEASATASGKKRRLAEISNAVSPRAGPGSLAKQTRVDAAAAVDHTPPMVAEAASMAAVATTA